MRIIVDSNIWISFMIGKKLSLLRMLLIHPNITIYICNELISEFNDVARRPKFQKYITHSDIEDTFAIMTSLCVYATIKDKAISPVRDVKDLYILSLAETVQADYIITGDKDLLVLESHHQTSITTFSNFINLL